MSTRLHRALRVRQDGPLVIIQPWEGDKMAGKSLTVDLSNASIRLSHVPEMRTRYKDAFGVAGLAKLVDSYALVMLTGGEAVRLFPSCNIHKLTRHMRLCQDCHPVLIADFTRGLACGAMRMVAKVQFLPRSHCAEPGTELLSASFIDYLRAILCKHLSYTAYGHTYVMNIEQCGALDHVVP